MIRIDFRVTIRRPSTEVFAFLTNADNYRNWQEGIVRMELLDDPPWRKGTRMKTVHAFLFWKNLEDFSELTRVQAGSGFSTRGSSGGSTYQENFSIENCEGGARLDYFAEIMPAGIFKLLRPLTAWAFRGQMRRSFAKLKHILETGAHRNGP